MSPDAAPANAHSTERSSEPLLPWLLAPLNLALKTQRGHATLVHASSGVGALPFVLALAQAWLCEASGVTEVPSAACGHCGSCRLIASHLHPDLHVLLPETLRRALAWPLRDDKLESDDKKKPSKQIRIDEVRSLIDWVHKTSARGRGKVVLLHPADVLNQQSANALLKTLEEPPPGTRLLLTTADPNTLLPTVRSRCQLLRLHPPAAEQAAAWLSGQGVAHAPVLLAACSGRPLDALALAQSGVDAATWAALPQAVARGQTGAMTGWPVAQMLDALHKLCHDAMARAAGAATRYFPLASVPSSAQLPALLAWSAEIDRIARHAEHPWNEALLLEALLAQGRHALDPSNRVLV